MFDPIRLICDSTQNQRLIQISIQFTSFSFPMSLFQVLNHHHHHNRGFSETPNLNIHLFILITKILIFLSITQIQSGQIIHQRYFHFQTYNSKILILFRFLNMGFLDDFNDGFELCLFLPFFTKTANPTAL